MTRLIPKNRAGITLTEILISIMIMGVGMVSLATLFPLGLERIRAAQRMTRSAQLANAALADIGAQGLFTPAAFRANGWFLDGPAASTTALRDPWIKDVKQTTGSPDPVYRGLGLIGSDVYYIPGDGLPVCYDPLWWAHVSVDGTTTPLSIEGRFGADVDGVIRGSKDPFDGSPASAYGLQRITTLGFLHPDATVRAFGYDEGNAASVFATLDDPLLLQDGRMDKSLPNGTETGNPTLPYVDNSGQTLNDWTYSWFFTGRRLALQDPTYVGDIVVAHNRQMALTTTPSGTTTAADERVVEAIFAYGTTVNDKPFPTATYGYSPQDRTVLLRWPATQPDPIVRVGSWIADVTYERSATRTFSRFLNLQDRYPAQRCHWYRVARRTEPDADPTVSGHRRMILTTDERMLSRTLLWYGDPANPNGEPVVLNAALVMPSVVHVLRNQVIIAK